MKKLLFIISLIIGLSVNSYSADVNVVITIPEEYVSRIVEMMDAKFPKQVAETTVQQFKRMVRKLVKNELLEYEKNRDIQIIRNSIDIPEVIIE